MSVVFYEGFKVAFITLISLKCYQMEQHAVISALYASEMKMKIVVLENKILCEGRGRPQSVL